MRALILLLPAILVLLVGIRIAIRRRPIGSSENASHNHLLMARWIDQELREGWVSTDQQERAKPLLKQFYGNSPKE